MFAIYLLLQSKIWRCIRVIWICLWEKVHFGLCHWLKKKKLISKRLVYYATNTKSLFYRGVCLFGKNLGQNPFSMSKSNGYNLLKTSIQIGGWGAKEKSEIVAIYNKYKNTLDDLINSSDTASLDYTNSSNWPRLIHKKLYHAHKSKDGSPTFIEQDCFNKDVLITSLEPASKI